MKKVILITGASSGIGKDGALRLLKEGHIVYGASRRLDKMKELEEKGGHILKLDVSETDSINNAVLHIINKEGRIDILWNNAGYSVAGAVEDVSLEDAREQFEVNLFGLSELTKAVLPYMRNKKSGTIINTSSVGGKIFTPLNAWYHASKHALEGWSDSLRIELRPFNINVVVLEPGGIKTEFGDVMLEPLLKRSKGGVYEDFVNKFAKSMKSFYHDKDSKLSSPSVISDLVVKIVDARKPKTRYSGGYMASTTLFLRKILSDTQFEKMIMSQIK